MLTCWTYVCICCHEYNFFRFFKLCPYCQYMSPNINHLFKHCSKLFKVVLGFYMLMLIFVCDYTEYSFNIWCFQAVWKRWFFFGITLLNAGMHLKWPNTVLFLINIEVKYCIFFSSVCADNVTVVINWLKLSTVY